MLLQRIDSIRELLRSRCQIGLRVQTARVRRRGRAFGDPGGVVDVIAAGTDVKKLGPFGVALFQKIGDLLRCRDGVRKATFRYIARSAEGIVGSALILREGSNPKEGSKPQSSPHFLK